MKRKDILKTGFAGILGVSLLMGGASYAYLQSESQAVINNFQAYIVDVKLEETTGQNYNIVPGTTQRKDPIVSVNAGLPTYVFVEVEDTTDDLVEYSIATPWEKLEGHDNVYYLVHNGETEGNYPVLAGNQVSYSPDLTNSDMLNGENLKGNLKLTFQAHAIQKDPFATPEQAYMAIQGVDMNDAIVVETSAQLKDILNSGEVNNATILVKNGTYNLDGAYLTGNNNKIVGESKTGTVINLTAQAPMVGQAGIYVEGENTTFENLTLKNDVAWNNEQIQAFNVIKSVSNNNVTIKNVDIINNSGMTALNFHDSSAVIENCYIQHNTTRMIGAVAATQSTVTVKNSTIETGSLTTPQYVFNYNANNASYNKTTEANLYLNNVSGRVIGGSKVVTVLSERDTSYKTPKLDHVFWNGTEVASNGTEGFAVVTIPTVNTIYTKNLD